MAYVGGDGELFEVGGNGEEHLGGGEGQMLRRPQEEGVATGVEKADTRSWSGVGV